MRSTWEVRNAIYEHLDGHDDDVVIDLTDVTTIDVTALRLLAVATRAGLAAPGTTSRVRGPGPAVRRMLHLTRLTHAGRGRARRRHRLSAAREVVVTRRSR